jgi:nucleotide-binding universal stress UspA family protein
MIEHAAPHIVVGIDGSRESLAALRWALREAAATGGTAEVVHCWQSHQLSDILFGSPDELRRGSLCMLQNEVAAALTALPRPPHVTQTSRRGQPAAVLTDIAAGAAMLVLGAHGHTDLHDLTHGKVAASCLKHADCPVVIINDDESVIKHSRRTASAAAH